MVESLDTGARLLCDGEEIFPALLQAIASARQRVALQFYEFADDKVGKRVLAALIEAARRGCKVRLRCDGVGSIWTSDSFFEPLRQAGGAVRVYHPLRRWQRFSTFRKRDHRKVLLVDNDWALVTGANIAEAYWKPRTEGGYHDLGMVVGGKAAVEAWALFEEAWAQEVYGRWRLRFPRLRRRSQMRQPNEAGTPSITVTSNAYWRDRWRIRSNIVAAVERATKSVTIVNPYFVPDRGIIRVFRRAARRGIRVRIIVPAKSDVPIVDLASLIPQQRLLRAGAEVLVWPGMVHAKAVLVDETWFSLGSYNFDHHSLLHNLELVVNGVDGAAGERLTKILDADAQLAVPRRYEDWKERAWVTRQLARLAYSLRYLL